MNNESSRFSRFADTERIRVNLKQSSLRGALFTAAGGGLDFGLRLISTLILARLLIPEHFGLLGMVTAITGFAERLSSMGLSTATIQALEIDYKQCTNLFWINVAGGCTFGLALCVMAPLISDFYQDPRLLLISIAIATNFLWRGLTVQHVALLHRQMKQPQVGANQLVASFLSNFAAVVLAVNGFGYWALVWRDVINGFAYALGVWMLCPWLPGLPYRGTKIGRLLRFGRDMTLAQILAALSLHIDSLLVGKFTGPVSLGLYRQAHNLVMTPIEQLEMPIWTVSQSGLSRLQNDPERYRRYYQQILFVVSLATMPLGAFVTIFANDIVVAALGQKWIGAVVFLQILGVGAAIQPVAGTSSLALVTCGKTQRNFWMILLSSIVTLIAMSIAIPWGAVGICLARVSATVFLLFPRIYYSFIDTPLSMLFFFRVVWRPFIGSSVMAISLLLFRSTVPIESGVVSLLMGCGMASAIYIGVLSILPGGRGQLAVLIHNLLSAFRRRSAGNEKDPVAAINP
jgi:O-antigen/teichoic acid export membrane protein